MNDQLAALQKSLFDFLQVAPDGDAHELEVMTPDRFLAYAGEQLELAKTEADGDAKARLHHLYKNVVLLSKNAFDGPGSAIPVYSGDISRQVMTAYSEQTADHTEKSGKAIPFASANTEANPTSNAFGRGGPQLGQGSFSMHGKIGKADLEAIAKAAASHPEFATMLMAALGKGEGATQDETADKLNDKAKVGKGAQEFAWERDLNADDVDKEIQF